MGIYKNRASAAIPLHDGDRLSLNVCTRFHPQLLRPSRPYGQLPRGNKHPPSEKRLLSARHAGG
ncbi:hypothetical protein, partial [Mesorhizobium sp. P5_C1]